MRVRIPDYVKSDTKEIIEVWGNYWHQGEDPQEMINWYASYRLACKVVWENEVEDFRRSLCE